MPHISITSASAPITFWLPSPLDTRTAKSSFKAVHIRLNLQQLFLRGADHHMDQRQEEDEQRDLVSDRGPVVKDPALTTAKLPPRRGTTSQGGS